MSCNHVLLTRCLRVQVFSAYKSGVEAMRSMRRDLTLEKVEDTSAEMQDLLEEGEDIGAVLSKGLLRGVCDETCTSIIVMPV